MLKNSRNDENVLIRVIARRPNVEAIDWSAQARLDRDACWDLEGVILDVSNSHGVAYGVSFRHIDHLVWFEGRELRFV